MALENNHHDAPSIPDMGKYMTNADGGTGASSSNAESGNQQVITKLLVSNTVAGSVIGKAGANIEQLQKSSGARIQLSRTGEFYPGTSDRVLLLSGSLHSVLTAIFLILEKISRDAAGGGGVKVSGGGLGANGRNGSSSVKSGGSSNGEGREDEVKLALSRRLCGLLIGHKGRTVQDFKTDSAATIRVQSLNELTPSDPERTITVSGARDQVLRAVALILNTLSMHEQFASYMETTLQLATNQGVVLPPRSSATRSAMAAIRASLTLYLADEDVGAILGRKGQHLVDIQQSARVTIKISDRSKMDPVTHEREVTISGPYGAVKLAEAMVAEKLNQSRARALQQGGGRNGVTGDGTSSVHELHENGV